jgi:nucleoid-associated protein YgaU
MRMSPRALLMLLGGIICLLACNLSRTPPTPTAAPAQPTQAVTSISPTLFASITPLGFNGGSGATAVPIGGTPCAIPGTWVQYTVQDGDTLGDLAQATGVTVQEIVNANCLTNPDSVNSGQVIYLPSSPISG